MVLYIAFVSKTNFFPILWFQVFLPDTNNFRKHLVELLKGL